MYSVSTSYIHVVFMFRLEFTGGGGETHASGQEALASALKVEKFFLLFALFFVVSGSLSLN